MTSDFNVIDPIPDIVVYSGSSTDLWQNPIDQDFSFKDTDFVGKDSAGDPR